MAFRDLVIQKRENDLVAASFGRGFYVLDDYSALRDMTPEKLKETGSLFSPRTAKWYIPRSNLGNTGADFYIAKNPTYGAVFTYNLANDFSSKKQLRKKKEKALNKEGKDIPFPGYAALDDENNENPASIWITIKDKDGNIIRHLKEKAKKGSHRIAWDLRHASTRAIDPERQGGRGWNASGPMVIPGTYTAQLSLEQNGKVSPLGDPVNFDVKPIYEGTLKGMDYASLDLYRKELTAAQKEMQILMDQFDQAEKSLKGLKKAAEQTALSPAAFGPDIYEIETAMAKLLQRAEGSAAREEIGERNPPSIQTHMRAAYRGMSTTYGPTPLHKRSLATAKDMMEELRPALNRINTSLLPALAQKLKAANAPYIIGQ